MKLQFFNYALYLFAGTFVFYLFRTFNWSKLKTTLDNAKLDNLAKKQIKKSIAKRRTAHDFENGRVVIYATSQLAAMLKYKRSQLRNSYGSRRTAKKP